MQIEWWYWVVAGVALMLCELAVPLFVFIWFGLSAVAVGILLALLPAFSLAVQLGLWLLLSILLIVYWFRIFKHGQHKTRVGMADSNIIGEVGLLTRPVAPFQKGEVRFQKPLLGSEVWTCISEEEIAAGERVRIVQVDGTLLTIAKA
ncbi:MAG TPA: NfeD family protein [Rhodocyclaceae bacterium]|nr:NfeD family protein [Rhodocyclaceae bacterium]